MAPTPLPAAPRRTYPVPELSRFYGLKRSFAHYEVGEIVCSVSEGLIKEVGTPTWKALDRATVEAPVGRRL